MEVPSNGPLTKNRMETYDGELLKLSLDFIDKAAKEDKPFFVWYTKILASQAGFPSGYPGSVWYATSTASAWMMRA